MSLSAVITAHAAGLGTMTSSSKLGEPLNAEIELLAVNPGELSTIQAALAADQVYQDQMLEKPASYPYIQIAVGNNSKGQPILKLTSSQPITEAFLDMLIQVDWPTGRLVKEYTLLLDPPGFNSNYVSESAGLPVTGQPDLPAEAPKAVAAPVVETEKPEASKPTAKKPATPRVAAKPSAPVEPAADNNVTADPLTTERGDTLYAIARQMKPDNVSVEQMLAALYRSNQDAFDGKNMNRLKVGKIIRMPDQATLNAISNQQAKNLVAEHNTNWLAYKNALSNVVKNSAASETGGNTQQSAGKIGSAQEKPVPQAPAGKDVLKLSAGDEKSATQTDKAAAKAAANAAQEEATAKENAIKEEQSRAAALEKQVADMKKLMELKNNALSQAENNAAKATAETQAAQAQAETPAAKAAETPAVAVPAETQPAPAAELAPAVPEAATVPATADQAVQPEQPSFMHILLQRLKNISPVLPWALIALPILICVWALIRIRRKKEIDTFEDAILTAPATEMQNNTVFGDTQAASGDTSFLTDFSQSGVGGMIDSHDVDPIAEAEVYMAYGRDAQAEEILKDAIQKDPERQELKLKLLEIYQSTNNKAAFESLAGEVYANVGPNDQTWSKVVAMGQKLDPENSLYQMPALDDPATAAPVPEADDAEQGYHFNFEAPALEFESSDKPARSVTEPAIVDDAAAEAVIEPAAEKFAELQTDFSLPADYALNDDRLDQTDELNQTDELDQAEEKDQQAQNNQPEQQDDRLSFTQPSRAEALPELVEEPKPETEPLESDSVLDVPGKSDFDIEPVATAETTEAASAPDSANDAELTPKALDLPSLNLDEALADTDTRRPDRTQTTTGEQTLSSDDAVFESLPELSLELGGPNDAAFNATPEEDDALTLEEISLDSSDDDKLSRVPEDTLSSENAFPEISLDLGAKPEDTELEFDGEPEEVNTKLDLIQAYIDMEDIIGAKELIEEVFSEGGERQRQRASELLAKVA
ncbi:MAG: FimV/HubP family polar landmark protein [Methylophilus sp.]|uniref:FimV/HubP family polar landmark protein n=1 Tax=Methylophilus sp. TaxID=29541 RepID=UPI00403541CC